MIIFIRKIPDTTLPGELTEFVSTALSGGWFRKTGKVLREEFLIMEDANTHKIERNGLVYIDVDTAGQRAVAKLKGKLFKNKQLIVREYVPRYWQNDRRDYLGVLKKGNNQQRIADRRRGRTLVRIKNPTKTEVDWGEQKARFDQPFIPTRREGFLDIY